MVTQETKEFSLYNFFSVLLPGVAFNLALIPLFPKETTIDPIMTLFPLIVGGFVTGQGLHSLAVIAQKLGRNYTHREVFVNQLREIGPINEQDEGEDQGDESPPIVEAFYIYSEYNFPELNLAEENNWERKAKSLYTLVNSHIHREGVGRSRIMQAIYAFCRSTWIASILLVIMYLAYCLLHLQLLEDGLWIISEQHIPIRVLESTFPYTTMIEDTNIPIGTILYALLPLLAISYITFGYATNEYKRNYIQYLISDFITLQTSVDYDEVANNINPGDCDDNCCIGDDA